MRTFIVAENAREAHEVARLYEIRPKDWLYLGDEMALRGTSGAQVIWACDPQNWRRIRGIRESLRIADARIAYVGCPYRR